MSDNISQPEQPSATQISVQAPLAGNAKIPVPRKKLSLGWKVGLFAGVFFLLGFIIINGQQLTGYDFIDRPGIWRLGAFIRFGFFLEFAAGMTAFVIILGRLSRKKTTTKVNPAIWGALGFAGLALGVVSLIFAVFAVRAAVALVSSPITYEGSCKVSYAYYGRGGNGGGSTEYYLSIPGHHNGFEISENNYKRLSNEPQYGGSSLGVANHFSPGYSCTNNVRLQYVSAEDTIIDLKVLNN